VSATIQVRLREASHSSHFRINQHPLISGLTRISGLTSRDYPLASYHTVLIAYFDLYEELEFRVEEFIENHSILFDYSSRQKLYWLNDDLRYFDLYSRLEVKAAPHVAIPKIESIGELIGVLYPMESSTLGGQVISKHLLNNHNLTRFLGARFFSGYGADTMTRWNEFCQFADTIKDDETQCKLAEKTAILTFKQFEDVLNASHNIQR
jgi:heme oxygenase